MTRELSRRSGIIVRLRNSGTRGQSPQRQSDCRSGSETKYSSSSVVCVASGSGGERFYALKVVAAVGGAMWRDPKKPKALHVEMDMIGGLTKTTSYLAIAAAASLVIGGVAMAPATARAADLGGDCCSDLEARVAELEATTVRKGNRKISLTLSGRVNANMIYWNDGFGISDDHDTTAKKGPSTDLYFGNAAGAESNFNLSGSGKISADTTAGFYMELRNNFGSNGTGDSQIDHQHGPGLDPQNMYVFINSKRLGEVRLGRTGSASGDAFYEDLGGGVGGLSGGHFTAGMLLRDNTAAHNLTTVSYGSALNDFSDVGGINRIWYQTPAFGGFQAKIAYGSDDALDGELTWNHTSGTLTMEAGVGAGRYEEHEAVGTFGAFGFGNVQSDWGISGSLFETGSGFFISGAYANATTNDATLMDKHYWFIRGGWQKNVNGMGQTTIDVQFDDATNEVDAWNKADKIAGTSSSARQFAVGIDQAIDSVASDVYLRYQHQSVDPSAAATAANSIASQSSDTVTGGMIVRF